jgi:hypothetical protein
MSANWLRCGAPALAGRPRGESSTLTAVQIRRNRAGDLTISLVFSLAISDLQVEAGYPVAWILSNLSSSCLC